jgi:Mrp family chromosome partitioning ATPase
VTQTAICDGVVKVTINLTTPACPVKDQMKKQAEDLLKALPGVKTVQVDMTAVVKAQEGPPRQIAPDIKHIVAVSSGKGGVGKSTVAVNLACALAKTGAQGRPARLRRLRPGHPDDDGLSASPRSRWVRRPRTAPRPEDAPRRQDDVDRLPARGGQARRLARADGAQADRAVL